MRLRKREAVKTPRSQLDALIALRIAEAQEIFLWERRHLVTTVADWLRLAARICAATASAGFAIFVCSAVETGSTALMRKHTEAAYHHPPSDLVQAPIHQGLAFAYWVLKHAAQLGYAVAAVMALYYISQFAITFHRERRRKLQALRRIWEESPARSAILAEIYAAPPLTFVRSPPPARPN